MFAVPPRNGKSPTVPTIFGNPDELAWRAPLLLFPEFQGVLVAESRGAHRQDFCDLRIPLVGFSCLVGQQDSAGGSTFGGPELDEDSVSERVELRIYVRECLAQRAGIALVIRGLRVWVE